MEKITRTSYKSNDKKTGGGLKTFSIVCLCAACVILGYILAGAFSGLFA